MLLGCKIHPDFFNIPEYRKHINKFDVWYVNSNVYTNLSLLDDIYIESVRLGKRMHGYYMFSARLFYPFKKKLSIELIKDYARNLIERYPLIDDWELSHEAFNDRGKLRKDNKFYSYMGNDWQIIIFKQLKKEFPQKNFFYSDYIRNIEKANSIINFVNNVKEIDGFNFQCHTDILHPLDTKLIRYVYKSINKRIVCLENVVWTVSDNDIPFNTNNSFKKLVASKIKKKVYNLLSINKEISERIQANRYSLYKKIALKHNIETFGIWCVSDNFYDMFIINPWQRNPGILNRDFEEKPAYKSIFS